MLETGLVISDTHWIAGQPLHWSYRLAKQVIRDTQPDFVLHLGDVLELSYLSSFNASKRRLLEGGRLKTDLDLFETEMRWLSDHTDRIMALEGNHDERIARAVDIDPAFEGLVEVENLSVVRDGTIQWYPMLHQPVELYDLYACHGWWTPTNPAKKHLDELGGNVLFGHAHRRSYWSKVRWADNREAAATGLGCLSDVEPAWLKGRPSGWQYDMAEIVVDNDTTRVTRLPIVDGKLVYAGRVWRRRDLDE